MFTLGAFITLLVTMFTVWLSLSTVWMTLFIDSFIRLIFNHLDDNANDINSNY